MRHRHLHDPGFTLAAVDDIIARVNLKDWVELGLAIERDGSIRDEVDRIIRARTGDEQSINHEFWRTRLALRPLEQDAHGARS